MVSKARQLASMSATSPVVNHGPFSDGFHAEDSLATHEAHELVMVASSKTGHDIFVAQTKVLGRPKEPGREVDGSISGGFHVEESLMTPGKADLVQNHSLVTVMSSICAHEVAVTQIEMMGQPMNSFIKVECPLSDGFRADEPPMTLARAGIVELGVQGGDEVCWVDFAKVAQGIETPH
nr:hypothetical protein CFP56_23686 [Quercus suber]